MNGARKALSAECERIQPLVHVHDETTRLLNRRLDGRAPLLSVDDSLLDLEERLATVMGRIVHSLKRRKSTLRRLARSIHTLGHRSSQQLGTLRRFGGIG